MRESRGERIFQVINIVLMLLVCFLFLIPFISVVSTSFISSKEYVQRGQFILFPQQISFQSYRFILQTGSRVYSAFGISLVRVIAGTALNLIFTFPLAYVLARRRLVGRVPLTMFVFFTMIFNGGLVPNFILVENLRLTNTLWALLLPGLINPWWMLIMRNFIMSLPEELEEAAIVDGASPLQVLTRIMLPLSMPSIATIGLFYAVAHWNAWFDAAIYLSNRDLYPLQLILRAILEAGLGYDTTGTGNVTGLIEILEPPPSQVLQSAMIVVTTLPILVVYPFIQGYFVKGMLIGSVKG
jgi:putative aldouronate transport system permease protein